VCVPGNTVLVVGNAGVAGVLVTAGNGRDDPPGVVVMTGTVPVAGEQSATDLY
jgi:hypothetical protein